MKVALLLIFLVVSTFSFNSYSVQEAFATCASSDGGECYVWDPNANNGQGGFVPAPNYNQLGCGAAGTCATEDYAKSDCGGSCETFFTLGQGWGATPTTEENWRYESGTGTCGDGNIDTGETCEPPGYFTNKCTLTGANYLLDQCSSTCQFGDRNECGPPAYCTGTAVACSSRTSQTSCQAQSGCNWVKVCSGSNNYNCDQYTTSTSCSSNWRCKWQPPRQQELGYCYGKPCSTWNNNQNSCQSVTGCIWGASGYCTGTATPCYNAPMNQSQSSCTAQAGCTWDTTGCTGDSQCSGYAPNSNTPNGYCNSQCKFTTGSGCNKNGRCEQSFNSTGPMYNSSVPRPGETQATCPEDCKTTVTMIPSVNLFPGRNVFVRISFNDSNYSAGQRASFKLVLDGNIIWNSTNGCPVGGKNVSISMKHKYDSACTWKNPDGSDMAGQYCQATSLDSFLMVTMNCSVPKNINTEITRHTLQVTPTIYSEPTNLNLGRTEFTVAGDESTQTPSQTNIFEAIINFFKQLFRIS